MFVSTPGGGGGGDGLLRALLTLAAWLFTGAWDLLRDIVALAARYPFAAGAATAFAAVGLAWWRIRSRSTGGSTGARDHP